MATGRYKLNETGAYFDPNDEGPDQASPEQIAALQAGGQQPAPQQPSQPYPDQGGGGIEDQLIRYSEGGSNYPTMPGGFQSSEGEGGITGRAQDPNFKIEQQPVPSTSGSYPSPYQTHFGDERDQQPYEQDFYGDKSHTMDVKPGESEFNNFYANYWAPDRAQVLASMRLGAQPKFAGAGQTPGAAAQAPQAPGGQAPAAPGDPYANRGRTPPGFDEKKWDDPNKHDPKYDAGRMLASGSSLEQIGAYIQQTYPGYKYMGGDKIQGPDGYIYDFSFGSKAGINRPMWEQVGGGPGGSAQSSIGAGAGAGGGEAGLYGGTSGFGGLSGAFGGGQLGDAIARLLARGEAGADPRNPNISGPTAAYRATVERQGRRNRNAMAERFAAAGLNPGGAGSGAFDSAVQSEGESEGINVANYQGQLITNEIAAQRQDVINALQFAQGQERLQLQQYLAILNDKLQRAQMAQQNQQYYDNLSYNMGRDAADLDSKLYSYLQ